MERNDLLTARSWLSAGWATFSEHQAKLAFVALVWFAWDMWNMAVSGPPDTFFENRQQLVASGVSLLFLPIVVVGYYLFCLQLVRGVVAPLGTVLEGFRRWVAALVASILIMLIVVAGCILLVYPGIFWALKFSLAYFALMDKRLSVIGALKYSAKITTGAKVELFYVGLVYGIPSMALGALELGFKFDSLIYFQIAARMVINCVLWPWMCCSLAVAYDRLSKLTDQAEEFTAQRLAEAANIPPDVKSAILSGQYSKNEIVMKYGIPAAEIEEIYKMLERKD
jgi:hypothetical protein